MFVYTAIEIEVYFAIYRRLPNTSKNSGVLIYPVFTILLGTILTKSKGVLPNNNNKNPSK